MRVAYVCNEYPPSPHGGIGTFIHDIAHGMTAAGHQVTVVEVNQTDRTEDDRGVRVVRLDKGSLPGIRAARGRLRLYKWLSHEARRGLDIVETTEFGGLMPFPLGSCPVVVRLHLSSASIALAANKRPHFGMTQLESLTLRCHPNWIAVSEHARLLTYRTFGLRPVKERCIYYPVTEPAHVDFNETLPDRYVLFAGTVNSRKGALVLAHAAREFLAEFPDVWLFYAGELRQENGRDIRPKIEKILGPFASRVRFCGRLPRSEVFALMRRATVFAFPSTLETFGLVVGEAMLAGCPVVVTDGPPFSEFVTHRKTGLLVQPSDSGALAAAVGELIRNADLRTELSFAAKVEIAERFSLNRCVRETESFYRECINRHASQVRAVGDMEHVRDSA